MAAPAKAGMRGQAPSVKVEPNKSYKISGVDVKKIIGNPERFKYEKCWKLDEYRRFSPGENLVDLFLETAKPKAGETVVDWGCGTGRAGYKLYKGGLDVTLVDFVTGCLDDEVSEAAKDNDRLRFVEHDLAEFRDIPSTYGFCTDVLEHIPEHQVRDVLNNILRNSRHTLFQVSTVHDGFGAHPDIGEELHVTVKPYSWWLKTFADMNAVIHHSNDMGNHAIFYVTGWRDINLQGKGSVNISHDQIIENMRENAKHGLQPVRPHEQQEREVVLLAGGPTLNDFEDEILEYRRQGAALVTVNGAYKWAIDRGFSPSLQLIIDGREHNKRFTEKVTGLTDQTKYICASQCHPSIFEDLPKDRTYLWQVSIDDTLIPHIKEFYGKMYEDWFPCPGGSTVTTRALCLLLMLGFYKFHIYGFDSCLFDGKNHHAYDQPENDNQATMEITVGKGTDYEKVFKCHPWHVFQAKDFEAMVPRVLKDAKLDVRGDGLIAYLIETGARMHDAAA